MKYTHLLYVRQYSILACDYVLFVYGVNTNDIFHTIGEVMYRSESCIDYIQFRELSPENYERVFDFLAKDNITVVPWHDKYFCGGDVR